MKTFKQHLNEKVPKDDLNWITTGGSFGKKRRFPTFIVKKEGNKYKAYDEQNKMDFKVGSNSLEGLAKMLKPYIKKRTGSWKFEEVDLMKKQNIIWTHPKMILKDMLQMMAAFGTQVEWV